MTSTGRRAPDGEAPDREASDLEGADREAPDRLRDLAALTDTGLGSLSVEALLDELLERIRLILDADTSAVLLAHPATDDVIATSARGIEEEMLQGVRVPYGKGFAGRIAADRRPLALDRVDASTVHNPLLWEKGIQVMLGVPLLQDQEFIGVLHVGRTERRPFVEEDVHLLEIVAERVAGAVQSRRLAVERAAASVLERSLQPSMLPAAPGLQFGARYVTAASRGVGGDWYDAFFTPVGTLWMVAGDVAGHGLAAAVVMGRVRSTFRSYALLGASPAEVLELTDRKILHFELGSVITMVAVSAEPPFDELRVAMAGHPPPVVAAPSEGSRLLDIRPEPPLGAFDDVERTSSVVGLPPGGVLALYTDGLIERRDEILDAGLERLRRSVVPEHPELVCRHVMHALIGTTAPADDVALLVLRRTDGGPEGGDDDDATGEADTAATGAPDRRTPRGGPQRRRAAWSEPGRRGPRRASERFDPVPRSVPEARSFARRTAAEWGIDDRSVALVVTELAANVVRHAGTPYEIRLCLDHRVLEVEVEDGLAGRPPRMLPPSPASPQGRGLQMVGELARAWGFRDTARGKVVWARLDPDLRRARGSASLHST